MRVNPIKLMKYFVFGWMPLGRRHCVMCRHQVWRFLPHRGGASKVPSLMRVLDVVGSDVDHFECPRCGSHDRERHLLMYLEASGLLSGMKAKAILHFAPEKRLSKVIAAAGAIRYLRCDLYPRHPGVERIDMLNMKLESNSFDLLIANHVMEHVADDRKALAEICRVLKRGGYAILQTPYSNKLHQTWQDDGIVNENDRLIAYGQEDHVRLYGRDIFDRFAAVGLISRVKSHFELLPDADAGKLGVNTAEPFMLFQLAD